MKLQLQDTIGGNKTGYNTIGGNKTGSHSLNLNKLKLISL